MHRLIGREDFPAEPGVGTDLGEFQPHPGCQRPQRRAYFRGQAAMGAATKQRGRGRLRAFHSMTWPSILAYFEPWWLILPG